MNKANAKQANDEPIIIIGGGMVGASLALALAHMGVASRVFEAFSMDTQQQPSFDDRSVALAESSLRIFNSIGLSQSIMAAAQTINNIHISEQGKFAFARLKDKDYQVEQLGAVIENWRLGQLLQAKIKQSELIEYFCPAQVLSIENQVEQAQIKVAYQEKELTFTSPLLVLADGARSPLRKQLNIQSNTKDFAKCAIVCNVQTQLAHNNWAYERFTEDGPLALLPLSGNRLSIVWSRDLADKEHYLQMPEQQFAKQLELAFGARLGKITKVGKRQSFPLVQQVAEPSLRGRCLLVGNSAQSLHPIAGQGFNLGLRDVAFLCQSLLSNEYGDDFGSYARLSAYQEQRRTDRQKTLYITESLARLYANPWTPLSITRNLLLKGLDLTPLLKKLFAHNAMGFSFDNARMCNRTTER